ncbi:MAG: hypothetical protein HON76_21605 [Candidatus Scalindua sp.]|jgi:hypothetical protein|nr:hypothetical protein [Candidatus Scalindua sp.]MBT5304716.1 hypothetical protein [Candidatus Scalindua sp.]MBT6048565.1 hypothetical protein [Candidatus Scalindua sp.]MBT6229692.1 hypothetical protein [Candidatus Scalindua sp.]MBT6565113.1 hypothetical protein [Candidatus Scalindua sp.]
MHENQQAEQRVRFYFITISISFSAIGTLLRSGIIEIKDGGIGLLLLVLFFFGHTVFDRVQMRDLQLRKHFLIKKEIQKYFEKDSPELTKLFNFQKNPLKRDFLKIKSDPILKSHRITSSMNYIVMVVNSLLTGLIVLYTTSSMFNVGMSVSVTLSLLIVVSYLYLIKKYSKYLKRHQMPWKYM